MFGKKSKISITLDSNVEICVKEYAKRIHKPMSYVVNSVLAQFCISQAKSTLKQGIKK